MIIIWGVWKWLIYWIFSDVSTMNGEVSRTIGGWKDGNHLLPIFDTKGFVTGIQWGYTGISTSNNMSWKWVCLWIGWWSTDLGVPKMLVFSEVSSNTYLYEYKLEQTHHFWPMFFTKVYSENRYIKPWHLSIQWPGKPTKMETGNVTWINTACILRMFLKTGEPQKCKAFSNAFHQIDSNCKNPYRSCHCSNFGDTASIHYPGGTFTCNSKAQETWEVIKISLAAWRQLTIVVILAVSESGEFTEIYSWYI